MTTSWVIDESEGVASGDLIPVAADGKLIATLQALWTDVEGVQLDLAMATDDVLTPAQAIALAEAVLQVARIAPPVL